MILYFRKLSNKLYKNSKTYKSIRWIFALRPFFYTLRFLNGFLLLDKLDLSNPYEGIIAKNFGFLISKVSNDCVQILRKMYYEENNPLQSVVINQYNIEAFKEIFGLIEKPIIDYLGTNVKLDGITYMICERNSRKKKLDDVISTNWHTDNVGARLKVFVCFEGDGTKPTLLIKPKNIKKSLIYKIRIYFLEVLRWFGIENNYTLDSEMELKHKKGSLIILDTQFLHRGERKISNSQRSLLLLEFSNPEKHKYFEKGISKGPIGTDEHNQFYFSKKLEDCKNIYKFLDKSRITEFKDIYKYQKV